MKLGTIVELISKKLFGEIQGVEKFCAETAKLSDDVRTGIFDCIVAWSERIELPTDAELAHLYVFVKNNGKDYWEKGQYEMTDLQFLLSENPEEVVEAAKRIVDTNSVNTEALSEIAIDKLNFNTWSRRMAIWCLGFMDAKEYKDCLLAIYNDDTDDDEVCDHALEACIALADNKADFINGLWDEYDRKRMLELYKDDDDFTVTLIADEDENVQVEDEKEKPSD